MNEEIRKMLERQQAWQKSRKDLSWSDKLRQSVTLRNAARSLRRKPTIKDRAT